MYIALIDSKKSIDDQKEEQESKKIENPLTYFNSYNMEELSKICVLSSFMFCGSIIVVGYSVFLIVITSLIVVFFLSWLLFLTIQYSKKPNYQITKKYLIINHAIGKTRILIKQLFIISLNF